MRPPVLVAQTPRAGRWHHQTLLPAAGLPAGLHPLDYAAASESFGEDAAERVHTGVGRDFVAAWTEVEQPTTGRRGREVIVLVLPRPIRPGDPRSDELRAWLGGKLVALGQVVAGYPWDGHDGSDVRLGEFDAWGAEAAKILGRTAGARPVRPRRVPRWALGGAAAVLLLVLVLIVFDKGGGSPGTQTQATKESENTPYRRFLDAYAGVTKGAERDAEERAVLCNLARVLRPPPDPGVLAPGSISQKGRYNDVVKHVTKHEEFRSWLARAFPDNGADPEKGWAYVGVSDGDREWVEAAMAAPASVLKVRTLTLRFQRCHAFLLRCDEARPKTGEYEGGAEDRGLSNWLKKLPVPKGTEEPIAPLPFVAGAECEKYRWILARMAELRDGMATDHLLGATESGRKDFTWEDVRAMARAGKTVSGWEAGRTAFARLGWWAGSDPGDKPPPVAEFNGRYADRGTEYKSAKRLLAGLAALADGD